MSIHLLTRYGLPRDITPSEPDVSEYYFTLTVQSGEVDAALTNFPVYVNLANAPAAFWTNVQSDGGDIRVTESDGTTRCPVDLVSINTTTEVGELHFLASSLSASANTVFRIYYGKTGGDLSQPTATATYGRNAVWADYELVTHDGGTSDSTGNYTLTPSDTTAATGKIGDALEYTPGNASISTSSQTLTIGSGAVSVSAWLNYTAGSSPVNALRYLLGLNETFLFIAPADLGLVTDEVRWQIFTSATNMNVRSAAGFPAGSFSSLHATKPSGLTADDVSFYFDGSAQTNHATDPADGTGTANASGVARIGNRSDGLRTFNGDIDELRIRLSELSTDWIAAEHSNQHTPTTFYSVGTQQSA